MSRILAIDYGKKRTGIAVTDPMQIIANGLTTVPTSQLMDFVLDYVRREAVERIIIGHPKQMNNEDSENMKRIVPFMNQLKKKLPDMPVELYDERFTSVLAHQAMLAGDACRRAEEKGQAKQGFGRRNQRHDYSAIVFGIEKI